MKKLKKVFKAFIFGEDHPKTKSCGTACATKRKPHKRARKH